MNYSDFFDTYQFMMPKINQTNSGQTSFTAVTLIGHTEEYYHLPKETPFGPLDI